MPRTDRVVRVILEKILRYAGRAVFIRQHKDQGRRAGRTRLGDECRAGARVAQAYVQYLTTLLLELHTRTGKTKGKTAKHLSVDRILALHLVVVVDPGMNRNQTRQEKT